MSIVRPGNAFDLLSLDIWDPLFFANTRVDRKETPRAPIIVADLPGMEEGEGRVL